MSSEFEDGLEPLAGYDRKLQLPDAPSSEEADVKAWREPVEMFSFLPAAPDPNPMFLQKRVYQGSSGEAYPLPFIDRISTTGEIKSWQAIHLENRYLRLMILPEIGGRIHIGLDKTNGYDFFYRQNVIRPALVGLAGPWVSGGVEFNWPQHHRPATFMPVDTEIERHADGSVTVWCSDYDRATGMKGMHGVCLHPEKAVVELKARLYNTSERVQTFLWWANVAARVDENYQSFFPPDVSYVADHAKRGGSTFPLADGQYYGVNYGERAEAGVPADEEPARFKPGGYPANDLSRYANIPVPTSYMVVKTNEDFFGGYDHAREAGFVHVANHHIAPGKKQWTWGNHEFGYAWDRCLTLDDGPYVELMAGVYTDNQPDFSFLAPGETKTFSQFWYPLRKSGVPLAANLDASIRLEVKDNLATISGCVTHDFSEATISLKKAGEVLNSRSGKILVQGGFTLDTILPEGCKPSELIAEFSSTSGDTLKCSLTPSALQPAPSLAVEPLAPEDIQSIEELYLTGLHLEQYRHATRSPDPYWQEALRRDPGDARCNHALGRGYLMRGQYDLAERHLRRAIERLTALNPNPADGEAFYTLGLTLRCLDRPDDAYSAFYKALWNSAWRSAAYFELSQIDLIRGDEKTALDHLKRSLTTNTDHLNARNLYVSVSRSLGLLDQADMMLQSTRLLDPLDLWSRYLSGMELPKNGHHLLELGLLLERCGQYRDALNILDISSQSPLDGSAPLAHLAMARCSLKLGHKDWEAHLLAASAAPSTYCFPSGTAHLGLLEFGLHYRPGAATFHAYLGNLLYHHRRHEQAMQAWEKAVQLDASQAQPWRNLGIAYFNIMQDEIKAQQAFDCACAAAPYDARLLYERDQLQKRLGKDTAERLAELLAHESLIDQRDDLCVELATLYNELDNPQDALAILDGRLFQPWEGGEGLVLAQYTAAHLKAARQAMMSDDARLAKYHCEQAIHLPQSLGEAKHLLANESNVYFWLGESLSSLGDRHAAQVAYLRSADRISDFQGMSVQPFSEMTFWSGLSLQRLGREQDATELFAKMLAYAEELNQQKATIDYFATSLPTLLLFEEDLDQQFKLRARVLTAAALIGLGDHDRGQTLARMVLQEDPNSLFAMDLTSYSEFRSDQPMVTGL